MAAIEVSGVGVRGRLVTRRRGTTRLQLPRTPPPPAFAIITSMAPKASTQPSTMASTCAESVTSATQATARPPSAWISATASSTWACVRAATSTLAPALASAFAMARPRPRPPPVTTTLRPVRLRSSSIAPPSYRESPPVVARPRRMAERPAAWRLFLVIHATTETAAAPRIGPRRAPPERAQGTHRARRAQPSGQHRWCRARDEDHGF